MPGEAAKHESRDSKINLKIFFDFWIAAVVFPGYREKKRCAAKYPRLYGPQKNMCSFSTNGKFFSRYNLRGDLGQNNPFIYARLPVPTTPPPPVINVPSRPSTVNEKNSERQLVSHMSSFWKNRIPGNNRGQLSLYHTFQSQV